MNKTPISQLQELMAAKRKPLPIYIEDTSGLQFKCTVTADGVTGIGLGSTKKGAKHEAAKNILEKLGTIKYVLVPVNTASNTNTTLTSSNSPKFNTSPSKNYVGELNELASKKGMCYPEYYLVCVDSNSDFIFKCSFCKVTAEGRGCNKKDAKQDSARAMLEKINNNNGDEMLIDLNAAPLTPQRQKPEISACEKEKLAELFNKLSFKTKNEENSQNQERSVLSPAPSLFAEISDDVPTLKQKLKYYGVEFEIKMIQKNPYIACFSIKGTNFTLLARGGTENEALKNVLRDAVLLKKTGCSLTNTGFN